MLRLTCLGLVLTLQFAPTHAAAPDDEFVGSTPCATVVRTFAAIAHDAPCERITWQLALAPSSTSGDFTLRVHYGVGVPNTPDLAGGGTRAEFRGTWTIVKPTTAADSPGIRLAIRGSRRVLEVRRLDDNLLHIQDEKGALLVGNGGWSHTLNRRNPTPLAKPDRSFEPVVSVRDTDAGVFDGRSPCLALAALLDARVESNCQKLKWRLTLHRDPATNMPGRYSLEGTLYRDRPRTGRWSIARRSSEPRTVVIRLDSDGGRSFLSLMKADDNILLFLDDSDRPLVGNAEFSFTLNRVPKELSEAIRR